MFIIIAGVRPVPAPVCILGVHGFKLTIHLPLHVFVQLAVFSRDDP
jgi:hypothetical protein